MVSDICSISNPPAQRLRCLSQEQELSRPAATGRRRRRELDLDKLPHFRHEHDLSEADKQCSGCGRAKDRIGQDESRSPGVRPGEARSARLRATQVRLPVLQRWRGEPTAAGAADCSRHRRTRADRSDHRRLSSAITCRCTGKKTSSRVTACTFPAVRCATGSRRRPNC